MSCPDVIMVISQPIQVAYKWNLGLFILEADILTCFNLIDHVAVARAMEGREWREDVRAALIKEMTSLQAEGLVGLGRTTQPIDFEVGGRTGGVDTPRVLIEMLQWAFAPLWRKVGKGES